MKCRKFKGFIQSYLDEELPEEFKQKWHQHFRDCASCRTEVRIYEKCIAMLRQFMGEEHPPGSLQERLKKQLDCKCFKIHLPKQK